MRCRTLVAKERRREAWDAVFISCAKHLLKRCQRSYYACTGTRRCSFCINRRQTRKRHNVSEGGKEALRWRKRSRRRYLKIQENKI